MSKQELSGGEAVGRAYEKMQPKKKEKGGSQIPLVERLENYRFRNAFDRYLTTQKVEGAEGLGGRVIGHENLSKGDIEALAKARENVEAIIGRAEKIGSFIGNERRLAKVIEFSPALRQIEGQIGSGALREILASPDALADLAIENPKAFEGLEEKLKIIERAESTISEREKALQEIAGKYGIGAEELTAVIEEDDEGKRKKSFQDLVQSHMPILKKIGNIFHIKKEDFRKELADRMREIDLEGALKDFEEQAGKIAKSLQGTGRVLYDAVDQGSRMRKMFKDYFLGRVPAEDSPEGTPGTLEISDSVEEILREREVVDSWGRFKRAQGLVDKNIHFWRNSPDNSPDRNRFEKTRDEFIGHYLFEKGDNLKGLWGEIAREVIRKSLRSKEKEFLLG